MTEEIRVLKYVSPKVQDMMKAVNVITGVLSAFDYQHREDILRAVKIYLESQGRLGGNNLYRQDEKPAPSGGEDEG